jgi:hypothetical protein
VYAFTSVFGVAVYWAFASLLRIPELGVLQRGLRARVSKP